MTLSLRDPTRSPSAAKAASSRGERPFLIAVSSYRAAVSPPLPNTSLPTLQALLLPSIRLPVQESSARVPRRQPIADKNSEGGTIRKLPPLRACCRPQNRDS